MSDHEPQYDNALELENKPIGSSANFTFHTDPKRLTFTLARYKFVAKMFSGFEKVLEVGCGDAWASRIVKQEVKRLVASDMDEKWIEDATIHRHPDWPISFVVHNMLRTPFDGGFDGIFSLDVIEHVALEHERTFVGNMVDSLCGEEGVLIVGTPSIHSQPYASPVSKAGHINCKDAPGWKELFKEYFYNVFIFSMNDEVVHTGFEKMANYYLIMCCGVRDRW